MLTCSSIRVHNRTHRILRPCCAMEIGRVFIIDITIFLKKRLLKFFGKTIKTSITHDDLLRRNKKSYASLTLTFQQTNPRKEEIILLQCSSPLS